MKWVCAMLFALATLALVGCNTMAGAGEDLQAGGKALTKSADEHS
ncbi:MAG: entericidin A/B family lipoprotein [Coxiellaceae bacterium]|nr:entericidin A/B family lipoprotein [Coxiellaceae bacterium]